MKMDCIRSNHTLFQVSTWGRGRPPQRLITRHKVKSKLRLNGLSLQHLTFCDRCVRMALTTLGNLHPMIFFQVVFVGGVGSRGTATHVSRGVM